MKVFILIREPILQKFRVHNNLTDHAPIDSYKKQDVIGIYKDENDAEKELIRLTDRDEPIFCVYSVQCYKVT